MRGIVLLAVLLAGCTSTAPPTTLPADWDDGVALKPYQTFVDHHGGFSADLYPTSSLPRPATCVAYRTETMLAKDQCSIRDAQYSWEKAAAWVMVPKWAQCDGAQVEQPCAQPMDPYKVRAVALDAGGHAIAWWDGSDGPNTGHATE